MTYLNNYHFYVTLCLARKHFWYITKNSSKKCTQFKQHQAFMSKIKSFEPLTKSSFVEFCLGNNKNVWWMCSSILKMSDHRFQWAILFTSSYKNYSRNFFQPSKRCNMLLNKGSFCSESLMQLKKCAKSLYWAEIYGLLLSISFSSYKQPIRISIFCSKYWQKF